MHKIYYIVGTMKHQTLMYGSILAVGIIAAMICVGMVTGFSVAKPFISVDPVSDKNVGDQFTITGKTSLPAGTEILAEVYPASFEDQTGTGSGEFTGATGTVTIAGGTGGTNTWAFPLNTSTFRPMEYLVNVSSFKGDISKGDYTKGEIFGSTRFTVHPAASADSAVSAHSASSCTEPCILIDAIAPKTTGDLIVVSGTTNFPAGTELMVMVKAKPGSKTNTGIGSSALVMKGTGNVNRFTCPIDTSILKPDELLVSVTNWEGDLSKGTAHLGNATGTALFTLEGPYLGTDTPVQPTVTRDDFITLNAIGDRSSGDQFLVTGTTSLPVGTGILWQVTPAALAGNPDQAGTFSGMMANSQVTKGSSTANRVSFAMDTNALQPGEYNVSAALLVGDPGQAKTGYPSGSTFFTLN